MLGHAAGSMGRVPTLKVFRVWSWRCQVTGIWALSPGTGIKEEGKEKNMGNTIG